MEDLPFEGNNLSVEKMDEPLSTLKSDIAFSGIWMDDELREIMVGDCTVHPRQ